MRERTPGVGSFLSSSRALPGAYYSDSGGVWRSIGTPPPQVQNFGKIWNQIWNPHPSGTGKKKIILFILFKLL
jgi:hypothetical protein